MLRLKQLLTSVLMMCMSHAVAMEAPVADQPEDGSDFPRIVIEAWGEKLKNDKAREPQMPIVRYFDPLNFVTEEANRQDVKTPEFCAEHCFEILLERQRGLFELPDKKECLDAGLEGIVAKVRLVSVKKINCHDCVQCKKELSATYVVSCIECRALMHASCCNDIFDTLPTPIKGPNGAPIRDEKGLFIRVYACPGCTNPLVPEFVTFVS